VAVFARRLSNWRGSGESMSSTEFTWLARGQALTHRGQHWSGAESVVHGGRVCALQVEQLARQQ